MPSLDNLTLCRVCSPGGRPKSWGPPGFFFFLAKKEKKSQKFELRVPLVSTVNNYADFFTKPLKSKAFFGLRNKIMNIA